MQYVWREINILNMLISVSTYTICVLYLEKIRQFVSTSNAPALLENKIFLSFFLFYSKKMPSVTNG